MSDDKLELTAFHEAGHAVMALAVGRVVNKVDVHAKGTRLGVCKMSKGRAGKAKSSKASADNLEGELLILLGGMAAEARKSGRYNMQGASQDLREAEKLAMMRAGNANQAGKVLKRAMDKVHHLLSKPEVWGAVKVIAAGLVENSSMSGKEAKHLYELELAKVSKK